MRFPLRWSCQHQHFVTDAQGNPVTDDHGNPKSVWQPPVTLMCTWWSPMAESSTEPLHGPTGGDRVTADLVLVLDSSVAVDHRDKFVVDGDKYEVDGRAKDFDHGPWAAPGCQVVALKWVA